jgi:uncharacterized protein YndB with AHSA1/START domain
VPAGPGATSVVEHEIRIEAAPETVFAYFTDPERMVRWMGSEATLDPRPGGVCRIALRRGALEAVVRGRFLEVDPYTRVVFSWGWEGGLLGVPPESTRVEVQLEPDAGGTHVRIEHEALPVPAVEDHLAGWRHYFGRLRVAAEGGEAGHDDFVVPSLARALGGR